ncbi:hypothetical protein DSECCO2_423780 [anaerobic digester metagenome]
MALDAAGLGLLTGATHEGVATGALLLLLGLGVATHAAGLGGHAVHGLLGGYEGALFLAEGGVALGTGHHALGRGGVMTDRTVLVLLFVLLVVEGHGVDESRLGSGLGRFGREQEEIGLAGFEPGRVGDLLERGADGGVMAAGAFHGTAGLLGLGDLHVAGHALLVRLILVFGKGKIAFFGLVLGVALGAVVLLPSRCGDHLGRLVPVVQGLVEGRQRAGRFRRPGMTCPALSALRPALFAGLGRVRVTLDAVVVVNGLDLGCGRVCLALELGRDRVTGHLVAGFALPFDGLGVLVMLEPDNGVLEITELLERVDGDEIRAQLLRSDLFLLSPKSVQTDSGHCHAYAQDSDPSQHWSSLLHVKIPLLKSTPENSGNHPRQEAPPPGALLCPGKNQTSNMSARKPDRKFETDCSGMIYSDLGGIEFQKSRQG